MAMKPPRWSAITQSEYEWERDALEFLREHLPDHEPWRAWTNFEFIDDQGRVNEIDALVFTPYGFVLIEIKSRPGSVEGDAHTWSWNTDGRRSTVDNPLRLANSKAKRLASLLRRQTHRQEPRAGTVGRSGDLFSPACARRSEWIRAPEAESSSADLQIMDWQAGSRSDPEGATPARTSGTHHLDDYVADPDKVYLAPESLDGTAAPAPHHDVYSLGAIAYHLFTGLRPRRSSCARSCARETDCASPTFLTVPAATSRTRLWQPG